ncbi:MAG TPA: hypothetical protein VGE07_25820 [Herpetosiphonaceae bacterium]
MPIDLGPLFAALTTFVLNIFGAVFGIWFMIKLGRHAMEENKDPVKIGQDIIITCIMLALAFKGQVIIDWARTAIG